MPDIKCISCGNVFDDYSELASHIISTKKGHRKGRKWAAQYVHRNLLNKRDNKFKDGKPAPPKTKPSEISLQLSGNQRCVNTVCPKCHSLGQEVLEAEYANSPNVWRLDDRIVVVCIRCRR